MASPRVVPGLLCAAGLVTAGLALDVVLIRRSHEPISTVVRDSPVARAIALGIAAHLAWHIPHDPLTAVGGWLVRKGSEHDRHPGLPPMWGGN